MEFLPDLEPWQRQVGFWFGVALIAWGVIGALWHVRRDRNRTGTIEEWLSYHERAKYPVLTDEDLAAEAALKAAHRRRRARQKAIWEGWRVWAGSWLSWLSSLFGPKMIPFATLRDLAPQWGVDLPRYGAGQNNAYYLEGALQQAAARGELRVEGRKYRGAEPHNDPLVSIPAAHFEDYGFGHGVLGYDVTDNEASHTGDVRMMTLSQRGKEGVTYYDLHLSKRGARAVVRKFRKDPKIERT